MCARAGKVLLYTRQNLHEHGGRYVAVTHADTPYGPWGELQLIELGGYDKSGYGGTASHTASGPAGALRATERL